MRPKALAILHALLALQAQPEILLGQKSAQDKVSDWVGQHQQLAWHGKVTEDDIKHELNHLRTVLRKHDVIWQPPLRSLHFPPFRLVTPKPGH
jgi:hypothetical protein